MSKVVVTMFLSLDGIIDEPQNWSFAYWTNEIEKYKTDELFATDVQLLGRVTYQAFADSWPSQTDEQGFADRMNSLPKYVVSTTLEKAEWNNSHLIKKNVVEEVSKLKQQPGQDILVAGSATLVQTLMRHELIDEYRLMIFPVVLGKGKRLFQEGSKASLKLVETKTFSSGVVNLCYQPDKK